MDPEGHRILLEHPLRLGQVRAVVDVDPRRVVVHLDHAATGAKDLIDELWDAIRSHGS